MTTPATQRKSGPFTGNGVQTVFPYSFKVFAVSDVKVIVADLAGAETTLSSGFTVTANADQTASPGGNVTLSAPLANGFKLSVLGNLPLDQTLAVPGGGNFNPVAFENALDRLAMQLQQVSEVAGRAVVVTSTSGQDPATLLSSLLSSASSAAASAASALSSLQTFQGQYYGALAANPTTDPLGAAMTAGDLYWNTVANELRTYTGSAWVYAPGLPGDGSVTTAKLVDGSVTAAKLADGSVTVAKLAAGVFPRSYLAGLTLSTAGASTTMSIAAGQATDSANAVSMSLVAATSKTTASWAVGSAVGGLDTGAIANSTWYYFYAIRRPDTGVVDVVFSLSSSAPTLPTNYTQFRYIGAGLTNGSGQWTKFTQAGDDFYWDSPPLDASTAFVTTGTLLTLSTPRGRKCKVKMNVTTSGTAGGAVYISDPNNADIAPSVSAAPLGSIGYSSVAGVLAGGQVEVWTNTSAQIRHRESTTGFTLYIATLGWTDLRGKDL